MSKSNKCVKKYVGKKGLKYKSLLRDTLAFARKHNIKFASGDLGFLNTDGGACCALGAVGALCTGDPRKGYEVGTELFGLDYDQVYEGNDKGGRILKSDSPMTAFGKAYRKAMRDRRNSAE